MLKVLNLNIHIGKFHLLKDIHLTAETGKVTAILGANGAGKSSLLKAVTHELANADIHGDILLLGKQLQLWPLSQRAQQMAVLPQQSTLNFDFTCLEVILLGRAPHSSSASENHNLAMQAMQAMDISYLANRSYTVLSGGEKQRVQLARVLVQIDFNRDTGTPRLLIVDEPTVALDIQHQNLVLQQLQLAAQNNIAVLMVIHDINHALHYADQTLLLHDGLSYACGDTKTVLTTEAVELVFKIKTDIISHAGKPFFLSVDV